MDVDTDHSISPELRAVCEVAFPRERTIDDPSAPPDGAWQRARSGHRHL